MRFFVVIVASVIFNFYKFSRIVELIYKVVFVADINNTLNNLLLNTFRPRYQDKFHKEDPH